LETGALDRDRDLGDVLVLRDRDVDRAVEAAGGLRARLQVLDLSGHGRRGDVVARDRDDGRDLAAREGGVDAVVDLHDLEVARQVVRAGEHGAHAERREGEDQQDDRGEDRRDRRTPQHDVQNGVPEPALAALAPQPVQERDPALLDAVAEQREHRRDDRHRADHRHQHDGDRADAERREGLVAGQEHAGHGHDHGQAGDQHRAA
jgi:hypothetical protein